MSDDRRMTDPFKDDLHQLIDHVGAMRVSLGKIESQMAKVDDHHRTLYGTNGTPGLTIVVDRLDQVERSREKHLAVIYSSLVVVALKSFWDLITGHKGP